MTAKSGRLAAALKGGSTAVWRGASGLRIPAVTLGVLAAASLVIAQAPDTQAPSIAITSPAEDLGVFGTVTVAAAASDDVGVAGVQFQVDLADYGAEDTTPPYQIAWDASSLGQGAHLLSAIARDAAGNVAASDLVTVVVCGVSVQPCPGAVVPPPVNRPPVAVGDALTSTNGAPATFTAAFLLGNDTDPDNHALSVVTVGATSSRNGTIANNGGGAFTYTPPAGFAGEDTFLYTISDGAAQASAVVTVTVTAPMPAGLVAYYAFDESSGTTVGDLSGAGNSGTMSGATRAPGVRGGALRFDGVNDWVTVADSASLDLSSALTIEAWVNPAAQAGNWRTVVMKERTGGLAYALYAHDGAPLAGGTNRPAGYVNVAAADRPVRGSSALPLNTWSHLAMTVGGGSMRFYVNGVEVGVSGSTGAVTGRRAGTGARVQRGDRRNRARHVGQQQQRQRVRRDVHGGGQVRRSALVRRHQRLGHRRRRGFARCEQRDDD
jgi:hypothetical protein